MSRIVREPSKFTRSAPVEPATNSSSEITIKKINQVPIKRIARTTVSPKSIITRPQNITTFTPLPNDVMNEFLSSMTCLQLRDLKIKNPSFSKFITLDMLNKSVELGYPRSTGRAEVFIIDIDPNQPELSFYKKVLDLYKLNDNKIKRNININIHTKLKDITNNFNDTYPHLKDLLHNLYLVSDYLPHNIKNLENITYTLITSLIKKFIIPVPDDIVKGDIVVANFGRIIVNLIYNGNCQFIQLTNDFKLPLQFRVLEDNVPLDYWTEDGHTLYKYDGDAEIPYVNIDLRKYKKEILDNLSVYREAMQSFFTKSIINGTKVYLTFGHNNNQTAKEIMDDKLTNSIGVFQDYGSYLTLENFVTDYF